MQNNQNDEKILFELSNRIKRLEVTNRTLKVNLEEMFKKQRISRNYQDFQEFKKI